MRLPGQRPLQVAIRLPTSSSICLDKRKIAWPYDSAGIFTIQPHQKSSGNILSGGRFPKYLVLPGPSPRHSLDVHISSVPFLQHSRSSSVGPRMSGLKPASFWGTKRRKAYDGRTVCRASIADFQVRNEREVTVRNVDGEINYRWFHLWKKC